MAKDSRDEIQETYSRIQLVRLQKKRRYCGRTSK